MNAPNSPPQLKLRFSDEQVAQTNAEKHYSRSNFVQENDNELLHGSSKQEVDQFVQDTSTNPEHLTDSVRLDGGRTAWTQVVASFLINMNVYGLVNAFGDFQHFYETQYLKQYSPSTISWIGTLQAALTLFIGALAGPIFDKGHFMLTLRVASVLLVFSWMMLSLSTEYYQVSVHWMTKAESTLLLSYIHDLRALTDWVRFCYLKACLLGSVSV